MREGSQCYHAVMVMKIALVGGSGFIGFHLRNELESKGYEVVILDVVTPGEHFSKVLFEQLNLLNRESVLMHFSLENYFAVVNLAAITNDSSQTLKDYEVNFLGCKNLVDALEATNFLGRFIQISTQYVERPMKKGFSEKLPVNVYGESKRLAESIVLNSALMNAIVLRPTNVWGSYHPGFPNGFWKIMKNGFYLHPNRSIIRSYGYVESVCNQIFQFIEKETHPSLRTTFYIGDDPIDSKEWTNEFSLALTGKPVRVVSIWLLLFLAVLGEMFMKIGIPVPFNWKRFKSMTSNYEVDMSPTWEVILKPKMSLRENVILTAQWYVGEVT